jgi:hypothetical protein
MHLGGVRDANANAVNYVRSEESVHTIPLCIRV